MARIIVRIPNTRAGWIADEHLRSDLVRSLNCEHEAELSSYLSARGVEIDQNNLRSHYHLLNTLDDDLFGTIARILRFHNDPDSGEYPHGYVDIVEPDRAIRLSSPSAAIGTGFTLKNMHAQYKNELNIAAAHALTRGAGMKIAIVDSGIEPPGIPYQSYYDLMSPSPLGASPVDDLGHGTAMATIINDIAPDAELHVIRVFEKSDATLWDLIAGLSTAVLHCRAHIINLSIGFANIDSSCPVCGVYGHTRSRVFEDHLTMLRDAYLSIPSNPPPSPVFVAATGNEGDPRVDYPAAYRTPIAVGARTAQFERAKFSNYGKITDRFFLLPGGDSTLDSSGVPEESVGEGTEGGVTTYAFGTSVATAYASGLLALYWADKYRFERTEDFIVKILGECEKSNIGAAYRPDEHGNGYLLYR